MNKCLSKIHDFCYASRKSPARPGALGPRSSMDSPKAEISKRAQLRRATSGLRRCKAMFRGDLFSPRGDGASIPAIASKTKMDPRSVRRAIARHFDGSRLKSLDKFVKTQASRREKALLRLQNWRRGRRKVSPARRQCHFPRPPSTGIRRGTEGTENDIASI